MSINGVLEDLPLADVLQFIHLGQRTGTLYMWQGEKERAEIGFHNGRIISAWTPGQKRLGNLLVAKSLIEKTTLDNALASQRIQDEEQSIGQILMERGVVSKKDIYAVIREQVQTTIFDLVSWRHGYFQFEVDELNPSDDFAVSPRELLDNLDLNTQMLVLEATRVFDEKHRRPTPEPSAADTAELSSLEFDLDRAGLGREGQESAVPDTVPPAKAGPPSIEAVRCQVVSHDPNMAADLGQSLPKELATVVSISLREAGNRIPGEGISPIVIIDLRDPEIGTNAIASLARTRPAAPVIAVVEREVATTEAHGAEAYEAGALAVAEPDSASVVACCRNLIRMLTQPQPRGGLVLGVQGGFRRFRRVVFDVQSGLASATMALNLMHLISDSVERAVLFLVQDEHLVAVGAFGATNTHGPNGAQPGIPLAEATHRLKLRVEQDSVLEKVVRDAEPQMLDFDEESLPPVLADLVGRPRSGQCVLFPVLGAERAISVIYTDNGTFDKPIKDVQILELATSQVGMAFENELLRQQVGSENFGD